MSEVADKVYQIIGSFAKKKTLEEVAAATKFEELGLDSVSLIAILDEVEDTLEIKFGDDPDVNISMPEFVALVEKAYAEQHAA